MYALIGIKTFFRFSLAGSVSKKSWLEKFSFLTFTAQKTERVKNVESFCNKELLQFGRKEDFIIHLKENVLIIIFLIKSGHKLVIL